MHRASEDLSDPDRNLVESTGSSDMPEDLDLELITEESNELRIHMPPARIAARFYRPTNNRRKSSAASSRRNSISSAHSHQSHTSSRHGGPQSSYIAQHLRRASIIEDRRARLADRAAHAEKVRLRAALAKAAPRSATNSEERALAAQQAREKNLAEIVANCAEEVKRAKGIAESMKEKREAEVKKMRREMEERLAEAEKRRAENLNRGNNGNKRARSLSQARKSSSPLPQIRESMSKTSAASRIQQRWRIHQRQKAVKQFAELGLTIDGVRETSFEEVVDLLAQEKVLVGTARILRICGLKEGESGSVSEMTAVRTFLSAFLILGHPTQVLSSKGDTGEQEQVRVLPMMRDDLANPQLQDLVAKARDLLISFENVLSRLSAANSYTPPPTQISTLSEVYATFFNAFIAWKARDSSTLIDMMVLQFVELDSIWMTVKDSTEEAVTESYRNGIRENQVKLMVRIKKLAGAAEGKRLIGNAMREARDARAAKVLAVSESRPRAAESDAPIDLATTGKASESRLQTLTPPPTPHRDQSSEIGQPRSKSLLPDNRTLLHETAIKREYRIETETSLAQKEPINQLIFDTMRQEVMAGNSASWVLVMAENVRAKLLHIVPRENSMHGIIAEALDSGVVARELESGSFSYEKFFSFMATVLPRLCAPFRDVEVKELVENQLQSSDIVSRLQALIRFIDLMQLDFANFLLQQSVPKLLEEAAQYEMKSFSARLEENPNSLTVTETAWRVARDKVMAEAAKRDPENVQLATARPTPDRIYAQMLVDIVTSVDGSVPIPETLELDTDRIMRIRRDILRIITAGAILLQSKNLLKRDVRSQWKTEAARVFTVLESSKSAEQAGQGIQVALESSRSMPVATKNHIKDLVARVVSASEAMTTSESPTQPRDPVMRLLLTRLRLHFMSRLSAITEKEKVKSASTAFENLATLGLPEFVQRVGAMVEELSRVGALDRSSHGPWYEVIAGNVEAGSAESSSSS
jgi:hypothetical protein